jgi:FKBP-type peptidyl-prolyl cis-trans isomerase
MLKLLITLMFSIIPISSSLVAAPAKDDASRNAGSASASTAPATSNSAASTTPSPTSNSVASIPSGGLAAKNLQESSKFLEDNKKKSGVITLPSGLQYQIIKEGAGQTPGTSDFVAVHYRGTLINGQEFDSSLKSKQPATFAVNAVIPGWTEALQLMKPGSKWMLYVPPQLAYGEKGVGHIIQPNSALIFEVELISVKPALDEVKDGVLEDWEGLD